MLFDSILPIRFFVLLIFFSFRSSEWETRVRVRVRVPTLLFFDSSSPRLSPFSSSDLGLIFSYPKGFRSRVQIGLTDLKSVRFDFFLSPDSKSNVSVLLSIFFFPIRFLL